MNSYSEHMRVSGMQLLPTRLSDSPPFLIFGEEGFITSLTMLQTLGSEL